MDTLLYRGLQTDDSDIKKFVQAAKCARSAKQQSYCRSGVAPIDTDRRHGFGGDAGLLPRFGSV